MDTTPDRPNPADHASGSGPGVADAPTSSSVELPHARHGFIMAAAAVLLAGLFITAVVGTWAHETETRNTHAKFDRGVERLEAEAERRMGVFFYGLRAARGVFIASSEVTRKDFRCYYESRNFPVEFKGATGVGHASASPSGIGSITVTHIEPSEKLRGLEGRDLSLMPEVMEAIDRSVESGDPTFTSQFIADWDGNQKQLFALLAVFDPGGDLDSPAGRRAAFRGVVFKPIVASVTLDSMTSAAEGKLDVEVFEGNSTTAASLIYDADGHLGVPDHAIGAADYQGRTYFHSTTVTFGGRDWVLNTSTTPRFDAAMASHVVEAGVLGGVALSAMLAGLVWSLGSSRARALVLARDMTRDLERSRDRAESALRDFAALRHALDRSSAVVVTDPAGRIIDANDNFCAISKFSREELLGQSERLFNSGAHPLAFWQEMWQAVGRGEVWRAEVCSKAKDGTLCWLDTTIVPFTDHSGRLVRRVAIRNDITARKRADRELRDAAQLDRLTGLPNRTLILERLAWQIKHRAAGSPRHFAVLFLDFDRFKLVNDSLGHDAGDDLLRQIAQRLRSVLRTRDDTGDDQPATSAGRLGGDEFVVVLGDLDAPGLARSVADRLLETFRQPYRLGDHEVVSTASIGVVTSDEQYHRAEDMLRDADTAMYEAKLAGKGCAVFFDTAMREKVRERLSLEADLRRAVTNRELWIAFQPIVSLESGLGSGCEALVRWTHPTRGEISPSVFVPIAEEIGLIFEIGQWVLSESCRLLAQWKREFPAAAPKTIAVNLSRAQLALDDLPARVKRTLDASGLPAHALRLEVTENQVASGRANLVPTLRRLRELGVSLAMDDFGTGLSSLSGLQNLPFDVVKIDRAFVESLGQKRHLMAMAHSVVNLANNLGLVTIAEGVETQEQLTSLEALGCDYAQGYLFSKPLSTAQMEAHLAAGGRFTHVTRVAAAA